MNNALYLKDDEAKVLVQAQDISRSEYQEIYKGRLFCENPKCNAELVHNEWQKRKVIRYFSTRPGSKHVRNCDNEIIHNGTKPSTISIGNQGVNVSDKHIQDSLKDGFKKFYEQLHPSNTPKREKSKNPKTRKKKVVPGTDDSELEGVLKEVAITDGTVASIRESEPYIYKRELSDINDKDKKQFREIHTLIYSMEVGAEETYIYVHGINNVKSCIYFGTPFRTQYEQEYGLLNTIKKYVDDNKKMGIELICNCFGELLPEEKGYKIQIYSYNHFNINNIPFMQIIRKCNNYI